METNFKKLLCIPVAAIILTSCGSDDSGGEKSVPLSEKAHFTASVISVLEKDLRADSTNCNASYDLYFDFSATMKRAVNDAGMKELITNAFDGLGEGDKIYSIGENKELKAITGDKATKQNSVLGPVNYTQTMTFMTPNMNNIAANLNRPAVMITDFSVDEGRPTKDADGVTSSFVRGSEYADQLKKWFGQGGSIKIYGKMIAEGGSPMPVYAIAFLPAGYNQSHRMNRLITDLDRLLSKDIYFHLHSNIGKVEATADESIKDARKLAKQGSCKSLDNGYGEMMSIMGDKLMGVGSDKEVRELVAESFVSGIKYTPDTTSFLVVSGFKNGCAAVSASTKTDVSRETKEENPFLKSVTFADGNLKFGFDFNKAKQANLYQNDRLLRYNISVAGVEKNIRFNSAMADQKLQYKLKSGGKQIMNNCLYKSLEKAMFDFANEYKPAESVYSLYFYVLKKK